jgi:hypothetical protein
LTGLGRNGHNALVADAGNEPVDDPAAEKLHWRALLPPIRLNRCMLQGIIHGLKISRESIMTTA